MSDSKTIKLELVTLAGVKLSTDVYEVILPTTTGEISVFPGHEPLVTLAKPGVVMVRRRHEDPNELFEYFACSGGVVEINNDTIRVLVDEADHGDDIIEAESQKALERAIKLRDTAADQVELEKAAQLIDRHTTRLKVAKLRRHSRRKQ